MELDRSDVGTTLIRSMDRVRGHGLALTGLAYQTAKPGDEQFRVLNELAASFEREALLVEMIARNLCRECRIAETAVLAVFTLPMKVPTGRR